MKSLKEEIEDLIGHYYCEDSWYSCPLATDGCADETQTECNCNRDWKITAILKVVRSYIPKKKDTKGYKPPRKLDWLLPEKVGFNQAIDEIEQKIG